MKNKRKAKAGSEWRIKWKKLRNDFLSFFISLNLLFLCPVDLYAIKEKKERGVSYGIAIEEAFSKKEREAIKEWHEGPVRYILTYDETINFKQLKEDRGRIKFIKEFWWRRDPTPGTLRNEYRLQFWERVAAANDLFAESTKPGWMTDRGKIYVLFGPPDEIETSNDIAAPRVGQRETGHRGLERWVYHASKDRHIYRQLVIPFYVNKSGEYILSDIPDHYESLVAGFGMERDEAFLPVDTTMVSFLNEQALRNMIEDIKRDIGDATDDIRYSEKKIKAIVKTVEYYEPLQSKPEIRYFQSGGDKTYGLISVNFSLDDLYKKEIPEDMPVPVALYGKAVSKHSQKEFGFSSGVNRPACIAREGNKASIIAPIYLPQGEEVEISGVFHELYGGAIWGFQEKVQVPNFENCHLEINCCILAKNIGEEKVTSNPFPFSKNIIPKVGRTYSKKGDFVHIFYQICGLGKDKDGRNRFDVSYQIYYKKDQKKAIKIGDPIILHNRYGPEQGWSFPLNDRWPTGEYILEISIYDRISEQSTSYPVPFKVADGP